MYYSFKHTPNTSFAVHGTVNLVLLKAASTVFSSNGMEDLLNAPRYVTYAQDGFVFEVYGFRSRTLQVHNFCILLKVMDRQGKELEILEVECTGHLEVRF